MVSLLQVLAVVAFLTAIAGWFKVGMTLLPSITSAAIGALVSWSIFKAGRSQGKRSTTVDLYKEYYSQAFADDRVKAEFFFRKNRRNDWTGENPYDLPDPEKWRSGYSSVTRYFHRVSILYQRNEMQRDLAQELLSRELGYWFAIAFLPMRDRTDWWTKDAIYNLGRAFFEGKRRDLFRRGYLDGCDAKKKRAKATRKVFTPRSHYKRSTPRR
jgi:hypothetical protein